MYANLLIAMKERGITLSSVAKKIGINRNTLSAKINGGRFYTDELLAIRDKFFPNMTLDELSYRKSS